MIKGKIQSDKIKLKAYYGIRTSYRDVQVFGIRCAPFLRSVQFARCFYNVKKYKKVNIFTKFEWYAMCIYLDIRIYLLRNSCIHTINLRGVWYAKAIVRRRQS